MSSIPQKHRLHMNKYDRRIIIIVSIVLPVSLAGFIGLTAYVTSGTETAPPKPPPPPVAHKTLPPKPPAHPTKRDPNDPGPRPDVSLMTIAIEKALTRHANDPSSLQGPDMYALVSDRIGKIPCWKIPFSYRAKNGFGGLMVYHGAIWVRDGMVIKENWG